jgi:hypothetical protein
MKCSFFLSFTAWPCLIMFIIILTTNVSSWYNVEKSCMSHTYYI